MINLKDLKLKRPLVIFDLETTGTNTTKDKIVQFAATKILIDGATETKGTLVNPETHIPKEASDVHGITDDMVKDAPTFLQISKAMSVWLFGCDLGGFNSDSFDIPLLSEEFNRADIKFPMENTKFIDVFKLECVVNARTLGATYMRYTGHEIINAHDAGADVRATIVVLLRQLEKFRLPLDLDGLEEFGLDGVERVDLAGKLCKNEAGDICYNFGKSKGKRIPDDPGFGAWMLKGDFPTETKNIVKNVMQGIIKPQ